MDSFLVFYLTQIGYVFLVVGGLLVFFEFVLPFFFGVSNRLRQNFREFLWFQVGRSLFALIFATAVILVLVLSDIPMGWISLLHFSVFSQVLILLFFSELVIYGAHLAAHRYQVPLLSRAHRFHHTVTTDMDWTNSRKEHLLVISLFMLVYCLFFFVVFRSSSAAHVITTSLYLFLNAFSHYRVHFTLPFVDQIFLFPKDHYRHHTERSGPYGVALSLFDTLFATRG